MRTKSVVVVLALTGATVIGMAGIAQEAKAGPTGRIASAANVALAKPSGKSSRCYSTYCRPYCGWYNCCYYPYYYPCYYTYCPRPIVVRYCQPQIVEVTPVCVQPVCSYSTCSYYPCNGYVPQFASRYSNYSNHTKK
jgi:hypothetical protein